MWWSNGPLHESDKAHIAGKRGDGHMIVDELEASMIDVSVIGRMVGSLIAVCIKLTAYASITIACGRFMGWW